MSITEENRPICKCHGLPMWFSTHWRCRVKRAKSNKACGKDHTYNNSTRGYIVRRKYHLKKGVKMFC